MMGFPPLCQRPAFEELSTALQALELTPRAWARRSSFQHEPEDKSATIAFLMSIVTGKLGCFKDQVGLNGKELSVEQKNTLIDMASKRLAERCGRTAAPEMTRSWVIPLVHHVATDFTISIREPSMTGDNLGLKTWGTAYALAKSLEEIGRTSFSELLGRENTRNTVTGKRVPLPSTKVLELGAGTGLVGIAAAAIWGVQVILTDLQEIQENLVYNIRKNTTVVAELGGGEMFGEVLDWTKPALALESWSDKTFEIIVAADPLYDDEHPALVAKMIHSFLKMGAQPRALVAIPLRDESTKVLATELENYMGDNAFELVREGEIICHDDWESEANQGVTIRWTIWRRSSGVANVSQMDKNEII